MSKIVEFRDEAMIEREAVEWLVRMDGDEPLTQAERDQLRDWMGSSESNRRRLITLAGLWEKMNVLTDLAIPMDQARPAIRSHPARSRRWPVYAVAATAILGIAATFFLALRPDPLRTTNGFYATAIGEQATIHLADTTVVKLNTDTQIKIDYGEQGRDVYLLKGEAHFVVASNKAIPFQVYAGPGQVRAVGTAFSVYLNGNGVDVIVTEGRVALGAVSVPEDPPGDQPPRVGLGEVAKTPIENLGELAAGQFASIVSEVRDDARTIPLLQNVHDIDRRVMDRKLAWTGGVLIFAGDPLEKVVEEISRYTTVDIEFSDPNIGAIRIGGRFPVGETDMMFEALESTFGLEVTRLSQDRVLLSAVID